MTAHIRETDYLKAWALFALCSTVGGMVAGFIVGFILGVILASAGVDMPTIQLVCALAGFIVGLPISYVFFRVFVAIFIVRKFSAHAGQPAAAGFTHP